MRDKRITLFYHPKQVLPSRDFANGSRSPEKAKLLISSLERHDLIDHFTIVKDYQPFGKDDFKLAHTANYVDEFFSGKGKLARSNCLEWSEEFVESVCYSNANLYWSIRNCIDQPSQITLSPTSGFHHARPDRGQDYCTFSGQVIAATKLYRECGAVGAFLDLDAHFGNSIEDSRSFVSDLNLAIPLGCNINPEGTGSAYVIDLVNELAKLKQRIQRSEVHYVVWCHGADSHVDDDTHGQCTTEEWLHCSRIFYKWLNEVDKMLGRPLPTASALFGGYRRQNYRAVLDLHISDLLVCLEQFAPEQLNDPWASTPDC